jgi:hypothetical protein
MARQAAIGLQKLFGLMALIGEDARPAGAGKQQCQCQSKFHGDIR